MRNAVSEVTQFISAVQSAISEAKNRPFTGSEEELAKIAELNTKKDEALQYLPNVNEYDRKVFTEQAERLQAWEREARERSRIRSNVEQELTRLRDDIPAALPDLVRYRSLMQRYIEIASADDPLVDGYKRLLANFNLYLSLPSLNTFTLSQLPPTQEECSKIEMLLADVAKGTIWENPLKQMLEFSRAREVIENEVLAMSGDTPALINFYYIEYRERTAGEWNRLYSPKMLVFAADPEKPGVMRVFGKIYHAFNPADNVVETHTNEVFGKDFNTENYEFRYERKKEDNVSEYHKFLEGFSVGAADSDDIVAYLLDELRKLKINSKMEPMLKATAFKRISAMLNKNYGVIVPEFKNFAEMMDSVDVTVPWMNRKNPGVIAEELKFGKILSALPDFDQLKAVYRERCKESLERINSRYSCAGSVVVRDGIMEIRLVGKVNAPLEAIVSAPMPKLIVVSNDGKNIVPGAREQLINGMPLFVKR